jgi:O-methyltransferase
MTRDPRVLYLDLLKRSLLNLTHVDLDARIRYLIDCAEGRDTYARRALHDPTKRLGGRLAELTASYVHGWPPGDDLDRIGFPYSMIGLARMDNLQACVETVLGEGVPGDLIECGVWRGGSAVFMRALLEAYGDTTRSVWVADSFEGLPKPTHPADQGYDLSKDRCPMLAVDEATVRRTFEAYGMLDDRVRWLRGWFAETLPAAPIGALAVLRLDGDLYVSTRDALEALYDKVSPGGFVIVDDYVVPPCRQAVTDFRERRGIAEPVTRIDPIGVFWRKAG